MSNSHAGVFLSVVIPAYNEQHRLGATLESARAYLDEQDFTWEVTVIDDGSTDETAAIVADHAGRTDRINLLQYSPNRGKGYAVRHGILNATGTWRLFMDADNSTSLDHLDVIRPILEAGQCDVVIGSRHVSGARTVVHQPFWKEALGDLGGLLIRAIALPGIYDSQAGFKIFHHDVAERIFPLMTLDRWAFDVELLAVAQLYGYRIHEQPIDWYNDADTKVTCGAYLEVLRDVLRVRRNLKRGVYGSPD